MTERLREELHRIGENAPVAHVDPATWGRARRARTRDRALVAAAVVAVLALVGGLGDILPSRDSTPVAGAFRAGLPDHLYAVPERMSQHSGEAWARDEVTTDAAVGRVAAAWLTGNGLPVVVGATDGRYHLLDLPDFSGNNWFMAVGLHPATLALSPDGRRLAYSWATFGPDAATKPIPSGVRVVDLTTGDVRDYPLPGEEGTAVTALAWSRDGRWLGWAGARMGSWTAASMGDSDPVAGRISVSSGDRQEFAPGGVDATDAAVAIDDEGRLSLFSSTAAVKWLGRSPHLVHDRDLVAVRAGQASSDDSGRVALPSYDAYTLAVVDGRSIRGIDLGSPYGVPWQVRPLGWVGDEVLIKTDVDGFGGTLRLMSVSTGRSRVVGAVDGGVDNALSVAIDLVTAERPTVSRPEPDWPWSTDRIAWTIALGVAGALALAMAALALWRRTRHL